MLPIGIKFVENEDLVELVHVLLHRNYSLYAAVTEVGIEATTWDGAANNIGTAVSARSEITGGTVITTIIKPGGNTTIAGTTAIAGNVIPTNRIKGRECYVSFWGILWKSYSILQFSPSQLCRTCY
jgi:hypothetical protein